MKERGVNLFFTDIDKIIEIIMEEELETIKQLNNSYVCETKEGLYVWKNQKNMQKKIMYL